MRSTVLNHVLDLVSAPSCLSKSPAISLACTFRPWILYTGDWSPVSSAAKQVGSSSQVAFTSAPAEMMPHVAF